eukprot:5997503-Alexandrium_andersonii.AAC.1
MPSENLSMNGVSDLALWSEFMVALFVFRVGLRPNAVREWRVCVLTSVPHCTSTFCQRESLSGRPAASFAPWGLRGLVVLRAVGGLSLIHI